MDLIKAHDNISDVINSLDGISAALRQLSMNEYDENNNLFSILFYEIRRDIGILQKRKEAIQKELWEMDKG